MRSRLSSLGLLRFGTRKSNLMRFRSYGNTRSAPHSTAQLERQVISQLFTSQSESNDRQQNDLNEGQERDFSCRRQSYPFGLSLRLSERSGVPWAGNLLRPVSFVAQKA